MVKPYRWRSMKWRKPSAGAGVGIDHVCSHPEAFYTFTAEVFLHARQLTLHMSYQRLSESTSL
jgi:hypothetical protein